MDSIAWLDEASRKLLAEFKDELDGLIKHSWSDERADPIRQLSVLASEVGAEFYSFASQALEVADPTTWSARSKAQNRREELAAEVRNGEYLDADDSAA